MRIVKRNRYYCEFCKKSGGQSAAMKKHESRCTMNPNRSCGVCEMIGNVMTPISELKALLPDESKFRNTWDGAPEGNFFYHSALNAEVEKVMPELREKCNNCPACLMAALRQSKIPVSMSGMDFKKELDAVWNDFWTEENAAREQSYAHSH